MQKLYKQAIIVVFLAALAGCTTESQSAGQPAVKYTKQKRGAATLSGGAGYHGAYLVPNAPQETAAPTKKAPKAAPGKLPLPVDYPMTPAEEKMWNKLGYDSRLAECSPSTSCSEFSYNSTVQTALHPGAPRKETKYQARLPTLARKPGPSFPQIQ